MVKEKHPSPPNLYNLLPGFLLVLDSPGSHSPDPKLPECPPSSSNGIFHRMSRGIPATDLAHIIHIGVRVAFDLVAIVPHLPRGVARAETEQIRILQARPPHGE